MVAQGHTQEEGIDYDEVFAPVARIEAIRLFMAYASFKDFVVYQMDVKSAFLYGKIEEEVYVYQPPGFEDLHFPDKVYKVYVDDIIFGSTKKEMSIEFEKLMHDKFQMSSMGELSFFLGLQVKQKSDGIFISQDKYVAEILKKFDFASVKTASTLMETNKALIKDEEVEDVDVHLYRPDIMFVVCACARFQVTPKASHLHDVKRIFRYLKGQPKLGLWYPKDSPFNLEAFSDSDYAGASLDRKSTTGGCQFLGKRLISWQCKKQTIVANSTTKAEYVTSANCCGQCYGSNIRCLTIVKNLVFHSKTKHIEIRQHFIRDSYEKKLIQVIKIHTDQNVADLLIKAFDASRHLGKSKEVRTPRYLSLVVPLKKVGDEAVHKELGDRMERVVTTASSLEAKQDSEEPAKSEGFEQIVDFLNANPIRYALTINLTIYISCIQHFWDSAKLRTVNGDVQIQALIDGKKIIANEASIRRDLKLEDAEGSPCLPNATIFEELTRMGYEKVSQKLTFYKAFFSPQWKFLIHTILQCISAKTISWNEFSSTMASAIIFSFKSQLGDMSHHKKIYVHPSHTKNIFANMKREGNDFSGRITPLFGTMMVQPTQDEGVDSGILDDSLQTPITNQPSSSRSQKKQSRRKQRKDTAVTQDETQQDDSVPTPSNDLPLSGEDSMQLSELILLCTNLQKQVLDLEKAKDAQAKEIVDLKKRV
ncbi:putative ribonuclease H-like domain-containing protein [Tanacetum coccineum]